MDRPPLYVEVGRMKAEAVAEQSVDNIIEALEYAAYRVEK